MISTLANFNIINLIAPFHWGEHSATTRQIPISKIKGFIISNLTFQAITTVERRMTNRSHAVRYRDTRQATATGERRIADARHAISYRDTRQTTTMIECKITKARHAVRYRDARQASAIVERIIVDARHAIRDSNVCNVLV